ncbi:hypothetical protein RIF29_27419 [Crotalaria pallida]|uniref:Uncharacterized protein n=1 Tax=Crotalaria pallida TaxID=3830 RepID=A0AAN9I2C3_CROPI
MTGCGRGRSISQCVNQQLDYSGAHDDFHCPIYMEFTTLDYTTHRIKGSHLHSVPAISITDSITELNLLSHSPFSLSLSLCSLCSLSLSPSIGNPNSRLLASMEQEQEQEQLPSPLRRSDTSVPGELVELQLLDSVGKSNENIEDSLNQDDSSDDGSKPLSKRGKMQSDLKNQEQRDVDMHLNNDKNLMRKKGTEKKENAKKGRKKDKLLWEAWEEEHERWIDENTLEDVKLDDQSDIINGTAEASSDLTMPLLRYQKEWLFWALKQENSEARGGILADEMGMGKTIQSIALVLAKRELHQMSCEPDESIPSPSPGSSKVLPVIKGTLVICPLAAVTQWVNEIDKFTSKGSTKVLVYHGSKRRKSVGQFSDYDFVVTTYSTVEAEFRKDMSFLHGVKWQRIMLDEAHVIKSRTSNTTKAVLAFESTYKWALSGTPFQNSVGELYSLVRFLQIFPYSYYFCMSCNCQTLDRYGLVVVQTVTTIVIDISVGGIEVLKDILLRRTKIGRAADLALPPRIVSLRRDCLDVKEQDYYESLYSESQAQFNTYVEANTVMNNYAHIFVLLMRLRQAVDHPYLVVYSPTATSRGGNMANNAPTEPVCDICHQAAEDPVVTACEHVFCKACLIDFSASLGQVSCPSCSQLLTLDFTSNKDVEDRAKKTTIKGFRSSSILNRIQLENFQTSTKIEALREEIWFMIGRDGSAKGIVFSQFPSFLDLINHSLKMSGISCVQLDGTMTLSARDAAVKRFNDDPDCKIFLMSLKAGGVALNLTVASHVFIMDPWWNPAVERQAQDRIHRIGQHKPIRIVKFIIENTIEERILKLQETKELFFEGIIDGSSEAQKKLTTEDLRLLFN